jgi:hypothetical protein
MGARYAAGHPRLYNYRKCDLIESLIPYLFVLLKKHSLRNFDAEFGINKTVKLDNEFFSANDVLDGLKIVVYEHFVPLRKRLDRLSEL